MLKQNSLKFFTARNEIEAWLDEMKVYCYRLLEDQVHGFVVDVDESVSIMNKKFTYLPVKFNTVKGDFCVSYNQLTSLVGCPEVVQGDFYCANNQVQDLEYFPKIIQGDCFMSSNPLLGRAQNMNNFSSLLKIHEEIVNIKNEHSVLAQSIAKPRDIFQGKHKI